MSTTALDAAIQAYRQLNQPVPRPQRLPTQEEVDAMEAQLGTRFHADFRTFLLQASDVYYGSRAPVSITNPRSHTYLPEICESAWNVWEIPRELLPVCESNSNYYCITPEGQVVYWGHDDGEATETWPSLAAWINQVLIKEQQDH